MRLSQCLIFAISLMAFPQVQAEDLPSEPGFHQRVLKLADSKELRYTLHLPTGFKPKASRPLVIALHYGGEVTPWYGGQYLGLLVEPGLRDLGAILAAPDCPGEGWDSVASESAVLALVRDLKTQFKIDEHQVLLTGFSMGGVGAWHLAARNPKLFPVVIAIASAPTPASVDQWTTSSLLAIHGSGDEVFPLKNLEEAIQKLKAKKCPVQLGVAEGLSHYRTGDYVEPLRASIPWLRGIWGQKHR